METAIASLLGGELGVTTLLLLFILGLLTKRFVPWWVYEEMQARLDVYEEEAPALLQEVKNLLDTIDTNQLEGMVETRPVRRQHARLRDKAQRGGLHERSNERHS